MNKDLLFQLYAIHSPSGNEKKMRKFIKRYIRKNCGECEIVQDSFGNVLVTKGVSETYPCLASHIDQVQKNHSKDFTVYEQNDVVFAFSARSMEQQGLGADDKNGIFICLELLKEFDVMKCAFFVGEEVGCQGSNKVDLGFFKDCRFIVEPDRMHGNDLITSMCCGAVCSDEFIHDINAEAYGYEEEHGSITDVGELVERGVGISCLNLSCGYYNAHTSEEVTVLSELENCLDCVRNIVENCTKVYPFEYEPYVYQTYYGSKYGGYYGKDGYYSGLDREYDEDYAQMEDILLNAPDITFHQLYSEWAPIFHDKSYVGMKDLYDEIRELYGYDYNDIYIDGMDEEDFFPELSKTKVS